MRQARLSLSLLHLADCPLQPTGHDDVVTRMKNIEVRLTHQRCRV